MTSPTSPTGPPPVPPAVRYAWFLLGGLVTLGVLAAGVVTMWQVVEGNLPARQEDQTTVSSDGIPETLTVEGTSANVELIGADTEAVTADLDVVWYLSEPVVESARQGQDLEVDLYCRYTGVPVWFLPDCAIDYSAHVPLSAAAAVELTFGSILSRGMEGDADLQTTTGNIVVEDPAGSVEARASTGEIMMALSESPLRVAADTEVGDISIEVSRGDSYQIITDTAEGRSEVEVVSVPGAESVLDLRSTYGDITVSYLD